MPGPTLLETLGLPLPDDASRARARRHQRARGLLRQGQIPWASKLDEPPQDESLRHCTGLPTPADVFGKTPCFDEWVKTTYPELDEEHEDEDREDEDDDEWDTPWWIGIGIGLSILAWKMLDQPVGFDSGDVEWHIEGFEIDGLPWTVEVEHPPPKPYAARIGDPMLHGGKALPGGGGPFDVFIGGAPALTVKHVVGACPMATSLGVQHAPQPRAWTTTNTHIHVNGELLLRAGDSVMEMPGGPNPIISGAPTVLAGRPANPVMVQEVHYVGLDFFVDDLERAGWSGLTISLKASVNWNLQEALKGMAAIGLIHLGVANPLLAPVTGLGARALLNSMDKPEIQLEIEVDTGTLWAETWEEFASIWGGAEKVKQERYEYKPPSYKNEQTAEVDPENPDPPTKKDEKEGWKGEAMDKGPKSIEEDDKEWGPFRKRTRVWDADEGRPESWEENE